MMWFQIVQQLYAHTCTHTTWNSILQKQSLKMSMYSIGIIVSELRSIYGETSHNWNMYFGQILSGYLHICDGSINAKMHIEILEQHTLNVWSF